MVSLAQSSAATSMRTELPVAEVLLARVSGSDGAPRKRASAAWAAHVQGWTGLVPETQTLACAGVVGWSAAAASESPMTARMPRCFDVLMAPSLRVRTAASGARAPGRAPAERG